MSTSALPEKLREFLAQPTPAVMATLGREGQPVTVATWYLIEGDRILVNLDESRKRLEHLRREPRVSLTVLSSDTWYTHVSLQGSVVALGEDVELRDIDRLSRHYTGRAYPDRVHPRVSAQVAIDRWHGWGKLRDEK